ncbi:MAG: DUF819 family protein [Phaeodactylibacter sp.]|nr:DUF819 family protein [Phaeodactylibacter sp.]
MSTMVWTALQVLAIVAFPYATRLGAKSGRLPGWLSPVVLCYALGILLSNLRPFPLNDELSGAFTEFTIVMAIPLMLYATNLPQWLRHARGSLFSFFLCTLSGLAATAMAAFYFREQQPDAWRLSGMLVGIYTGGTPNMQAIGLALEAPQETIILLNAADILLGGIYLLFLTSLAPRAYGALLRPFHWAGETEAADTQENDHQAFNYRHSARAIALTLGIIGLSLALAWLFFGSLSQVAFIMLMLTTLSISASFIPRVRSLQSTFESGEYFLLMFCVALGMLADFSEIMAKGADIVAYTAVALSGTIVIHLLLAYIFRIDRDTMLFTSVAAIYGPAFIGQVAIVTGNRKLVFSGIAMGLLGYAIGNYLGIGLAYALRALL